MVSLLWCDYTNKQVLHATANLQWDGVQQAGLSREAASAIIRSYQSITKAGPTERHKICQRWQVQKTVLGLTCISKWFGVTIHPQARNTGLCRVAFRFAL